MFFCRKESLTSNDPAKILKEARKIIEEIQDKCRENGHTTPYIKSSGLIIKPKFYIKKERSGYVGKEKPLCLYTVPFGYQVNNQWDNLPDLR